MRSPEAKVAGKPNSLQTMDAVKCTACWQRSSDVHQNRNRPSWSYYCRFCSYL